MSGKRKKISWRKVINPAVFSDHEMEASIQDKKPGAFNER
jgi:hypothetical protein